MSGQSGASRKSSVAMRRPGLQAYSDMRRRIASGRLPVGEALPSERDLAAEYGIARNTARRVLTRLLEEGLIERSGPRERTVVGPPPKSNGMLEDTVLVVTSTNIAAPSPETLEGHSGAVIEANALQGLRDEGAITLSLDPRRVPVGRMNELLGGNPRGCMLFPDPANAAPFSELAAAIRGAGVPTVAHGDCRALPTVDTVRSDHEDGCRRITQWLLDRGCRRPLRFWTRNGEDAASPDWIRLRDAGYEAAMRDRGLVPPPAVFCQLPPGAGRRDPDAMAHNARIAAGYLAEWLSGDDPIDAILVLSDGIVNMAAEALRLLGRTPFDDVRIAGYDNYWNDSWVHPEDRIPPDVTVDKHNHRQGRTMAELLQQRARGLLPPEPQERVIPVELVTPRSAS